MLCPVLVDDRVRGDGVVMLRAAAVFVASLLGACALQAELEPADQCNALVDSTARLLDQPPDALATAFAELRQDESIEQALNTGRRRQLAWFREVGGSVTLCSYRPSRDECERDPVAINFREGSDGWYPVPPWAQGPACVRINRHGGRIVLPPPPG